MQTKDNRPPSLLFSKRFLRNGAIFLLALILWMIYLHWRKGDWRMQVPDQPPLTDTINPQ